MLPSCSHPDLAVAPEASLSPPEPRYRLFYIENLGVDSPMASQASLEVSQASQAFLEGSPASQASLEGSQASQAPPIATVWRARSGCPPHLRGHLERLVNGSSSGWLAAPTTGEIFETLVVAKRRLRLFSLTKGFNIVRTAGDTKSVPGSTF